MNYRNDDNQDDRRTTQQHASNTNTNNHTNIDIDIENDEEQNAPEETYEDAPVNQGLLSGKRKTVHPYYQHGNILDPGEWMRPYWLGAGLFLILFAFWLLDSLKDPIFVGLVDGKISRHQPTAKLCSVGVTLCLVCLLEFWTHRRQKRQREARLRAEEEVTPDETVLDPGGVWKKMIRSGGESGSGDPPERALDDIVSFEIFYYVGVPYLVAFSILAYLVWRFEQTQQQQQQQQLLLQGATGPGAARSLLDDVNNNQNENENPLGYYVLGYVLYATVESFGSLAVATFWSYTNSTLSLRDAETYYGPIIATAQLGAIGGSTLVATGRWESSSLLVVVALAIVLQLLLMRAYDRRFEPTSILVAAASASASDQHSRSNSHSHSVFGLTGASGRGGSFDDSDNHNHNDDDTRSVLTLQDGNATLTKPFWSGLYLIFSHSYVLLILGVSCLYEVAMTLLDYQMKLLGVARFHDATIDGTTTNSAGAVASSASGSASVSAMSFSTFMGHYGQVVNVTSLVFSSLLFPLLIRKLGLRRTLLGFPTMLLVVTFLAYGAMPGNLTVLFVSLSLLKAMTYSVHDPSKELLYIPTSNAVKFRAKFWIDVVGERISKAIGSAFNTMAGSVEQSVRIGTIPSLLTALGLWMACYSVGLRFDLLLETGKIVGLEHPIDPSTYSRLPQNDDGNDDGNDDDYRGRNYDYHHYDVGEVEINHLEEDAISTLDLMSDPSHSSFERRRIREDVEIIRGIEMPSLKRI